MLGDGASVCEQVKRKEAGFSRPAASASLVLLTAEFLRSRLSQAVLTDCAFWSMNLWARVGVLGTLVCCVHSTRRALAEPRGGKQPRSSTDQMELKLVQVLFRHGARTPLRPIPSAEQVRRVPGMG